MLYFIYNSYFSPRMSQLLVLIVEKLFCFIIFVICERQYKLILFFELDVPIRSHLNTLYIDVQKSSKIC